MAKKKEKKIVIHTRKQQELQTQKTLLPIIQSPFEILDGINRMYYQDPWTTPWWNHWIMNQSPGTYPENRMRIMPIDFLDTGEGFQIITEIPGVNKKDIEITITPKTISICGATEINIRNKTKRYLRKERGYSTFCRYLTFPEDVNPDKAEAMLTDGILQINIRKKIPSAKGTHISVK